MLCVAFIVLILIFLPSGVSALVPGESDYEPMQSVVLSDIEGDSVELVSTDTQTVLNLDKAVLPEGVLAVSFNAKAVEKSDVAYMSAVAALAAALNGSAVGEIDLFDLSLTDLDKNENITKLNGKLSITIACKSGVNSVFYFNEKTSQIEDMQGVLSENTKYITFETDHFSYFMLAKTDRTIAVLPKESVGNIGQVIVENSDKEQKDNLEKSEELPEKEREDTTDNSTQKPAEATDKQENNMEKVKKEQTRDITPFVCVAFLVLFCEFLFTLKRIICK